MGFCNKINAENVENRNGSNSCGKFYNYNYFEMLISFEILINTGL